MLHIGQDFCADEVLRPRDGPPSDTGGVQQEGVRLDRDGLGRYEAESKASDLVSMVLII